MHTFNLNHTEEGGYQINGKNGGDVNNSATLCPVRSGNLTNSVCCST